MADGRSEQVLVRLTQVERSRLEQAAEADRRSLSSFVRDLILEKLDTSRPRKKRRKA